MRAVGVVFLLPLLALGRGEEGEEGFCSADGLCQGRKGREEGGRRREEEEVRQQYEDFPSPEVSREQQEKEKLG